ncbi:MAG: serine hydrolase [Bacteroidales bacterium]|nr:serine hydrolase [Candidatus Cacconaster merdequi]
MKKLLAFFAVAAVMASCTPQPGTLKHATPESMGMNSEKLAQIDREAQSAVDADNIPGCVVAVVREDKIVFLKAYGNKQVYPDTIPMTTETVFDLASCSKCVGTTLSFMQLIENGYVRLQDEVSEYIPGFKPWVDPETGREVPITVQDLLTHTSGLASYINVASFVERFGEAQPDSLINFIATEVTRNFRPKTNYLYSCLNFVTLQNILQNITGERLADYAQKNVFDRLGLKHTCYLPKEHPDILPLVAPTELQADGSVLLGDVHDPIAFRCNCGNSGNAGVFSNCEDLAVICAAIMNHGEINGRRILSPMTVEAMIDVPDYGPKAIAPHVGRALGWDNHSGASTLKGDMFSRTRTICHTGYTGTSIVMDMDARTAVIVLSNRVHPYDDGMISETRARIANIVAGSIEK